MKSYFQIQETVSIEPRIFRLKNFFTEDEADALITNALSITAEDFRLKRSSVGAKGSIDSSSNLYRGPF
jgi:hypothetical protein